MKKIFLMTLVLLSLVVFTGVSLAANAKTPEAPATEKAAPAAVEEKAAPAAAAEEKVAPAEEKAVPEAPAEKKAKPAAKKADATKAKTAAKKVTKGETLTSLVKTFTSVHKDVKFAAKYVNQKDAEFDRTMAKALANELLKWKKAKIALKKAKKAKGADVEAKEAEIKEMEENIIAKYTEGAEPASSEEKAAAKTEEPASEEASVSPKTEKGKEILEKLRKKQKASETEKTAEEAKEEKAPAADEKKPAEEAKPAAAKEPAKIRVEPRRALYNKIEPSAEATTKITIRNVGRSAFEGTVVPIEEWISVNPTTITVEPGSRIDVDVTIKAQATSRTRLEGTIEVRSEGASSHRVPVVIRTK